MTRDTGDHRSPRKPGLGLLGWNHGACSQLHSHLHPVCATIRIMPQLVVVEKIDGTPVAWRCSDCNQVLAARGKLTAEERLQKVNAAFKAHLEEIHKSEGGHAMAFAAGVPLPK